MSTRISVLFDTPACLLVGGSGMRRMGPRPRQPCRLLLAHHAGNGRHHRQEPWLPLLLAVRNQPFHVWRARRTDGSTHAA